MSEWGGRGSFMFFFPDRSSPILVNNDNNDMIYLLISSPRQSNPCGPSQDNRTPATVVEINGGWAY